MSSTPVCYQINLQRGYGGGEVYTAFFSRTLDALGVKTVLFAHPDAAHWQKNLPKTGNASRRLAYTFLVLLIWLDKHKLDI